MVKKRPEPPSIVNRRAFYDYHVQTQNELTAGMVLSGAEVRAIRDGRANLKGAFVSVKNDELWLNNASLSLRASGPGNDITVDSRPRKLLASKKQISDLIKAKQSGLTIVPIKILAGRRYIKAVIAPAKGKKTYDKRQVLKKRAEMRDIRQADKLRRKATT